MIIHLDAMSIQISYFIYLCIKYIFFVLNQINSVPLQMSSYTQCLHCHNQYT